jgi:putative ABC transport system permease protein
MVGRLAARELGLPTDATVLGKQLYFDGRAYTIVGLFEAPATVMESEVWMPLVDMQIATQRDGISCLVATLGAAELADVQAFAFQRPDLELVVLSEQGYYDKLTRFFRPIQVIAIVTAGLITLGALFGGLNTMYAAFAARVRELGALQSLGYPRRALFISMIQESVLATSVGALLAATLGLFVLDGFSVRVSMGTFGLVIDSLVMSIGLVFGLLLGFVGAVPPAWRCLRMPITIALKAS